MHLQMIWPLIAMYDSRKKLHIFRLVCGNVCGNGMATDKTV